MIYDVGALELEKILKMVTKYPATNLARKYIMEISPTNSLTDIKKMYAEVRVARQAIIKYDYLPLGGLFEVKEALLRSKIGGILSCEELLNIVGLINCVSNVLKYRQYLIGQKIDLSFLEEYFEQLEPNQKLKTSITMAISDTGQVVDNASTGLFTVRKGLQSAHNRLRSKMNELLSSKASMLNESLIVSRNGRLCLPIRVEYKNVFKGIIHDESSSGTTVYIEPQSCLELNTTIDTLTNKEKKEVEEVLRGLSLFVASDAESLLKNLEILTKMDIIYAKAKFAIECDLNEVSINDEGIIDLKNARHPLIDKEKVVPINLQIGEKFQTIVITGPNTGGKTVALKTVGLLTLMMQSGFYVPASSDSKLAVFDNVFVDIGDEQSIEQSLSTFSSHMTKIIKIIDNLTINSLVLVDELGSGTDPKEGSSLAISIIDYLKERGARTICTTHYSDLKAYAFDNPDVCNASVEFNIETLEPTYRLLMGIPGRSNAIEIAKRLGLNSKIIDSTREKILTKNTDVSNLMEKLDEETLKMRNIQESFALNINEYNHKLAELEFEKAKLKEENDKIINKAKKEANKIIENAKVEVELLLKEIDELRKNSNFKEHELADIKYIARNLQPTATDEPLFEEELKVGDHVYIKSYDRTGIIKKISKDKYEVTMGQFTMPFSKKELSLTKPPVEKKIKKPRVTGSTPSVDYKLQLDLRGYRYEEVTPAIDQFIDKAYLANASIIYIVHGFGTGAVRNAVYSYLEKCPYAKSYRFGKEGEGLNGCTVVYLK